MSAPMIRITALVPLETVTGADLRVNPAHVVYIRPADGGGTVLVMADGVWLIDRRPVDQVADLIEGHAA